MNYKRAFIAPHPPIIIKEVGGARTVQCEKTIKAMEELAKDVASVKPDNIIVISPHGTVFSDGLGILYGESLSGDLRMFGHEEVSLKKNVNKEFIDKLIYESGKKGIVCARVDDEFATELGIPHTIDHGALVPLNFVEREHSDYNLVHITYGVLSYEQLYKFGMILRNVIKSDDESYVVIASGDLSHRLMDSGPYDFHKDGPEFDKTLVALLEKGDYRGVFDMDQTLIDNAGECGMRSIAILLGTFDESSTKSKLYSYEGPFGVGYSVFRFDIENIDIESLFSGLVNSKSEKLKIQRSKEDNYVKLAREAIENIVRDGVRISNSEFSTSEMIDNKAGVFVSIKKDGGLRGCIGTTVSTTNNIMEEIISSGISAAIKDPRFDPVEADELEELTITVDILMEAEKISDTDMLDVSKYGIIVENGFRRGLLLPNIEGVTTISDQLRIALSKGGIDPDESYDMYRFEVIRHH